MCLACYFLISVIVVNLFYRLHPASRWFFFNKYVETTIGTVVRRVSSNVVSAIFTPLVRGASDQINNKQHEQQGDNGQNCLF
jgi:hypothetical protein